MKNLVITMTKSKQELKAGTKTVFVETSKEVTQITEKEFKNITCKDTLSFFRRLGGTETVSKCYTCYGYVPYKVVSKNPTRDEKIVRTFNFEYK